MSTEQSELPAQLSTELAPAFIDLSEVTNTAARAASALLGGRVTVQVIDDDGLLSTNLVVNAREAMGEGGPVTIDCDRTVGIRREPGDVDTEVGTVAEVYLPAIDSPPRTESQHPVRRTAAASGVRRRGHGHLLVVEDEPAVARVVSRLLEDAGFTVEAPENADVALRIILAGRPADLLITDVLMPGLTGPELGRRVREFRRDLPVLFMSEYVAGTLDDVGLLGAGMAVLEKPFSRAALLDAVTSLLGDEPAERKPPARGHRG